MAHRLDGALEAPEGRGGLPVSRSGGPGVGAPRSVGAAAAWRRCRAGLRAQRSEDEQGVGEDSTTLSPPLKPESQEKASLYLRVLALVLVLVLAPVDLVPVVALGDAPVAAVVEGGVVGVGLDGGAVRRRSGRPVLGGEGIREGEAEGSPNTT